MKSRTKIAVAAVFSMLIAGCAHKDDAAETTKPKPKPTDSESTAKTTHEIPLRDPDVANELPDERMIGATPRTVGAGAPSSESDSGTVIAHPPKTPIAPPGETKETKEGQPSDPGHP